MSMKKNAKVFEIMSKTNNGKIRTVYAVTSLDVSLADCCKMKSIPLPSIFSSKVTAPMTRDDAINYAYSRTAEIHMDPRNASTKTTISAY